MIAQAKYNSMKIKLNIFNRNLFHSENILSLEFINKIKTSSVLL